MPAWLVRIFSPFINLILSFGLDKLLSYVTDYLNERTAKKEEHAKQEAAKKQLKEDLGKAGDDAKAQEDAYDDFFKRTNK